MVTVIPIKALKDNYIWLVTDEPSKTCLIIDPGEALDVLNYLEQAKLEPLAILVTHHHWDHINGINELIYHYPMPVYGPKHEHIPHLTHAVHANERIQFPSITFEVLSIPGHTRGHIAYYGQDMLFCGDTLFSAGCGYVFEGTPEEMAHSLMMIAKLPGKTKVFCGHEYTLNNLKFAKTLEPNNHAIQKYIEFCQQQQKNHLPTLPSTITLEKEINPFLRCNKPAIIDAAQRFSKREDILHHTDVFRLIREKKNQF